MWIYWAEQCDYCKSRTTCEYQARVKSYISNLQAINDKGVYGTLKWNCDYFNIDSVEYFKKHPGENSVNREHN